ncbi:HAD superfamily hydrolase (TIGR01549 family) [Salinibacterium sp. CAN_S4]|uniref:HAD family hydrolase n=1 Tax=Salinibacterium sp. CAN_S4 TaxID=2787727 RepID=UPI0018F0117A
MSNARVVMFDIDGTLVDSNFLHVEAWDHAFASSGMVVPSWRILRAIGADSDVLLDQLIPTASAEEREAVVERHKKLYKDLAPRITAFTDAERLIAEISRRGVRVVLATSAPQDELDRVMTVLDVADTVHAITSSEDVEKAKPEPDIISVALEKAGAKPSDAIMIGDSVWDVRAAHAAGVISVGVLSGGTGESELRAAGAVEVFDDVAALLAGVDGSALAALWGEPSPERDL